MKLLLSVSIILVIILYLTHSSVGCKFSKCQGLNDECDADMYETSSSSTAPKICNSSFICYNGKCMKPLPVGSPCNDSLQCEPAVYCTGATGEETCRPAAFANIGEKCVDLWDCLRGLGCNNSKCVVELEPESVIAGHQCEQGHYQCEYGMYCDYINTHKCQPRKKVGEKCSSIDECPQFTLCEGPTNDTKCIEMFTLKEGDHCSYQSLMYRQYYSSCNVSQGLLCNPATFKCEKINQVQSPSDYNCAINQGCKNAWEECYCLGNDHLNVSSGQCQLVTPVSQVELAACQSAAKAFYLCVEQSYCIYTADYEGMNTCTMQNCRKEYCGMQSKCSKQTRDTCFDNGTTYLTYGVCSTPFPSEKVPGSSNIIQSNTMLGLMLGFIIITFF